MENHPVGDGLLHLCAQTGKTKLMLNTKYITSSQNTTKFIALCFTIMYTTTCFGPF